MEQARESSDEWRFVSHLWAATGVTVKLATGWIWCVSYHWWAGCAAATLKKREKKRLLL